MIRIQLVDDHSLVREGLARLFEKTEDIEIAAIARDGDTAVKLDAETRADVLLMDLSMPGMDGIEATRQICEARDDARVVMLTAHSDKRNVLAALDAGAVGYLVKDSEAHTLIEGVRAAASGACPVDPRAVKILVHTRGEQTEPSLTGRETEVLKLVGRGLPNKQIARKLGIREKTVKSHLTRVFCQLGVSDRTQAALWAHEQGIA